MIFTQRKFKAQLQECMEFAESHSQEEYYYQAAEVLQMLIDGLDG